MEITRKVIRESEAARIRDIIMESLRPIENRIFFDI